jgi:hypothetical protein
VSGAALMRGLFAAALLLALAQSGHGFAGHAGFGGHGGGGHGGRAVEAMAVAVEATANRGP